MKSNSGNRFTSVKKNSECAANRQKKIDKNGKNLSFAEFLKNKSELLVFSFSLEYIKKVEGCDVLRKNVFLHPPRKFQNSQRGSFSEEKLF